MQQHQILSGSFGTIVGVLIPYVLASAANKDEEKKALKSALNNAIEQLGANHEHAVEKLANLIEKMVVDMRPSARMSVMPIGTSCRTMTIKSEFRESTFDEIDKAEIMKDADDELTELRPFTVLITELDLERGSCKAHIEGEIEDKRINSVITDPLLQSPNNPYSLAFAAGDKIDVKAKALLKGGEISRLYISDYGI